MSISIGGYIQPGYPTGLGHDMYQHYPQPMRYADPGNGQYMDYHAWMLNAANEIPMTTETYYTMGTPSPPEGQTGPFYPQTGVRTVKRRVTASRKERRRTQNINNAFASLRGCIPNVPADTKLSKIKTLRLACRYISYLMELLSKNDPELMDEGFKADLTKKIAKVIHDEDIKQELELANNPDRIDKEKSKSRTGWPQEVWASELKQDISPVPEHEH